jgi:hypothetical protein
MEDPNDKPPCQPFEPHEMVQNTWKPTFDLNEEPRMSAHMAASQETLNHLP